MKNLYDDVKPGQERLRKNLIVLTEEMSQQIFYRLAESYRYNEQRFKGFYQLTIFFTDALEKMWNEEFPQKPLDHHEMSYPILEASDNSDYEASDESD